MSSDRALRGSCHCGRNQYIVRLPHNANRDAEIRFDTDLAHRVSSASPLSAFLRVPLPWVMSEAFAFFPDETRTSIRRTYSHPSHTQRVFCGYCSTPLSYWSEEPRTEADYIQLTLGSLLTEDLHDLEDLGLLPDHSEGDELAMDITASTLTPSDMQLVGREFTSVPWFDTLMQGSRLGNMRAIKGTQQSRDGRARVEFEISEWTADNDEAESSESSATGKRKRRDTDQGDPAAETSSR